MIAAMARRISSPIIVGRTAELEALLAAAESGAAVDTETVVVRGEAGVGKSRRPGARHRGACPGLRARRRRLPGPRRLAAAVRPDRGGDRGHPRTRDAAGVRVLLDGSAPTRAHRARLGRVRRRRPPPVPEAHIPGRVFDAIRTLLQRAPRHPSRSCSRTSTGRTRPRSTSSATSCGAAAGPARSCSRTAATSSIVATRCSRGSPSSRGCRPSRSSSSAGSGRRGRRQAEAIWAGRPSRRSSTSSSTRRRQRVHHRGAAGVARPRGGCRAAPA